MEEKRLRDNARVKAQYTKHKAKRNAEARAYHAANKERRLAENKAWSQANNARRAASRAQYVAAKRQALAPWADMAKIEAVYAECARITKETEVEHHVDHIFPLRGELICGLHVENNLQILIARDNIIKKNKWSPG